MSNELTAKDRSNALQKQLIAPAVTRWLNEIVPKTFAKYLTPERVVKIVLGAASRNPILLQCTQASIIKSVAELVSLGIEPGGPLQQGYLVPRKNKGQWECQPIVGYRGLISLLRRSGEFKSVAAYGAYEHDLFEPEFGSTPRIVHKPHLKGERGELVAVYSVAEFSDGGGHLDLMTRSDVERIRGFSPAGKSEFGPWVNHFDEMAKKTVIRRASKLWPMSSEDMGLLEAIEAREDGGGTFDILDVPEDVASLSGDEPQQLPAKQESATDALLGELQQEQAAAKKRAPAMGVA